MTVTNTSYSTNSYRVNITNELSSANILSGVNTAITALGWTSYDTVTNSVPGAGTSNAFSPIYTYVYRAPNNDGTGTGLTVNTTVSGGVVTAATVNAAGSGYLSSGTGTLTFTIAGGGVPAIATIGVTSGVPAGTITIVSGGTNYTTGTAVATYPYTWKYFILRWDVSKQQFFTSACEYWNNVTHVATNETWSGAGSFPQQYDLKDCFILVGATARHLVLWPFIKSEPGMWAGVFEFERVVPEDTVGNGAPCFAWTNSVMIGTPYGKTTGTISRIMYAFPRTQDGFTGAAAAQIYAPVTNRGMFPPSYPQGTLSISVDTNLLHLASYYNLTYGWDTSTAKAFASPISVDGISKAMPFGRTYNLSTTKQIGSFLDTTTLTLDTTGGWVASTGTSADCVILPMNGGTEIGSITYGANKMSAPVSTNAMTTNVSKMVVIGDNVWACAQEGVYTWAMSAGTVTPTLVYASNVTFGVIDIVFDGARSIYASTYFGVAKIDTETLAATSYVFPNGAGSGLTVTTTVTGGAVTAATVTAAGTGYLGQTSGTLYFTIPGQTGLPALCSISLTTAGATTGAVTVQYGGTGYTAGTALPTAVMMGGGYLSLDNKYLYVTQRFPALQPTICSLAIMTASFTATISGTTMTVSAVAIGNLAIGQTVTGSGVTANSVIIALGSGTGGTGTYTLSQSSTVSTGVSMSATMSTALNYGASFTVNTTVASGAVTAAAINAAGTGYLGGLSGTLYFQIAGGTGLAIASAAVTNGAVTGTPVILSAGYGYSGSLTGVATVALPALYTSPTALAFVSVFGVPVPDYNGTTYAATQNGTSASAQSMRLVSYAADNAASSYNVANLVVTTTSSTPYNPTSFYIDPTAGTIYCIISAATTGTIYRVTTALVSAASASYTTAATTGCQSYRVANNLDYFGDLAVVPFRGLFYIFPKGRSTTSTYNSRVLLSDPTNATAGNPTYLQQSVGQAINTNVMGDSFNHLVTNGPRVIFSYGSNIYYSNNAYTLQNVQAGNAGRLLLRA